MLVSVTFGYVTLRYILQNYGVELLTEIHLKIKEKKNMFFQTFAFDNRGCPARFYLSF